MKVLLVNKKKKKNKVYLIEFGKMLQKEDPGGKLRIDLNVTFEVYKQPSGIDGHFGTVPAEKVPEFLPKIFVNADGRLDQLVNDIEYYC